MEEAEQDSSWVMNDRLILRISLADRSVTYEVLVRNLEKSNQAEYVVP